MTLPANAQAPVVASAPADAEHRELARWQRKLLPFMSRFLVVMAIGFFAISLVDVYEMRNFVKNESTQAIRTKIEELLRVQGNRPGADVDVAQQALLLLEADALDKRYRQASALLMSRIWTRQLAFITGMVLAFIGSVFIIGKLTESKADVTVGASEWKAGITSTSPGLILAFFGTLLMGIALVVQPRIEVQDRPVYFMTMGIVKNVGAANVPKTNAETPLPDPFGDSRSAGGGGKQKAK
jgi:uncharacterized membrane protein